VFSLLYLGVAASTYIGMVVTKVVLPTWGWQIVFNIFGVMSLVSLSLLYLFGDEKEEKRVPRGDRNFQISRIQDDKEYLYKSFKSETDAKERA